MSTWTKARTAECRRSKGDVTWDTVAIAKGFVKHLRRKMSENENAITMRRLQATIVKFEVRA